MWRGWSATKHPPKTTNPSQKHRHDLFVCIYVVNSAMGGHAHPQTTNPRPDPQRIQTNRPTGPSHNLLPIPTPNFQRIWMYATFSCSPAGPRKHSNESVLFVYAGVLWPKRKQIQSGLLPQAPQTNFLLGQIGSYFFLGRSIKILSRCHHLYVKDVPEFLRLSADWPVMCQNVELTRNGVPNQFYSLKIWRPQKPRRKPNSRTLPKNTAGAVSVN